jgi:uncharacterized OB-fold protein
MSQGYQRMLPQVTDENRFYWTGGADGVLRMLRCDACSYWVHPPLPLCPRCHSRALAPQALSGKGRIFSYTLNYKPWGPGLDVPYTIAVVALDEQPGLQLTTNIVNLVPEQVRVDMNVTVTFVQDEDVWLPMFRPDDARAQAV